MCCLFMNREKKNVNYINYFKPSYLNFIVNDLFLFIDFVSY